MKGYFKKGVWYLPTTSLLTPALYESDTAQYELYLLAESIGRFGLMCPVTVCRAAEGYRVIDGQKRVRAAFLAGLSKVPCVLWESGETDLYRTALHHTVPCRDPETAGSAVRQLLSSHSLEETACALGVSTAYIGRLLSFSALEPSVRGQLRTVCDPLNWTQRLLTLTGKEQDALIGRVTALLNDEKTDVPMPVRRKKEYRPRINDRRFYENSLKQLVRRMTESGCAARLRQRPVKGGVEWVITVPVNESAQMPLTCDG